MCGWIERERERGRGEKAGSKRGKVVEAEGGGVQWDDWLQQPQLISTREKRRPCEGGGVAEHVCGICILPIVVVIVAFTVALWKMLQNTAECVEGGRAKGKGKAKRVANLLLCVRVCVCVVKAKHTHAHARTCTNMHEQAHARKHAQNLRHILAWLKEKHVFHARFSLLRVHMRLFLYGNSNNNKS